MYNLLKSHLSFAERVKQIGFATNIMPDDTRPGSSDAACDCSSHSTRCSTASGISVLHRCGCDIFLAGKRPFCYVQGSGCPAAFASTDIPGTEWRDCTTTPPRPPPSPRSPPAPPLLPHACCEELLVAGVDEMQPTRSGTFRRHTSASSFNLPVYVNQFGSFLYFWDPCKSA